MIEIKRIIIIKTDNSEIDIGCPNKKELKELGELLIKESEI